MILDRAEKAIFDIAERRIRQGFVGHPRDRQGELPHHRPALAVEGAGHRPPHRLRGPRRDDQRPAEGRPDHRGRAPGDGQDLLLPEHRAARLAARRARRWASSRWRCRRSSSCCACSAPTRAWTRTACAPGNLQEKDWARLAKAYADLSAAQHLHRRLGHAHAARDARQVPPPEGRARPGPGHRGLPAARLGRRPRREPPAGDLVDQPLAEGAGQGAGRAR